MEKQTNNSIDYSYLISILITQNGYSFYDYYPNEKKIDVFVTKDLKETNAEDIWTYLQQDLIKHNLLKNANAGVNITYHHPYFAVVPDDIYDSNFKSDYLKFNAELFEFDTIANDFNVNFKVAIPFIPYENIHNELLNSFKQIEFTHSINSCLKVCASLSKDANSENIFIIKNATSFVLIIFKERKLTYCNYFEYATYEDFMYYLLFTLEQFKCDRNEISLSIWGHIDLESKLHEYLFTYIKNIHYISESDLHLDLNIAGEENHHYMNNPFLALHLCE